MFGGKILCREAKSIENPQLFRDKNRKILAIKVRSGSSPKNV